MQRAQLVLLNTISQVIGQVLGLFLSLTTFIFLARYLGADSYGEYSIVTTYLGFFAIAADWSLYLLVVKALVGEESNDRRRQLFGEHLAFRLTIGLTTLAVGAVLIWFFPYSIIVKLGVLIGVLAFLSNSISQLIYSIFQAELKLYLTASLDLFYKALLLTSVIAVGRQELGLTAFIVGMVIAALSTLILAAIIARKFVPIRLTDIRINFSTWREIFTQSWALGVNGIFSTVVFKIDILILSFFAGTVVVGIYSLPSKIVELLSVLSGAFIGSVFPIISQHHSDNSEKLAPVIQRSALFLLILAAFVSMMTLVLAKPLVLFAGGNQFTGSIAALRVLSFFPLLAFFGNYFYHLAVVFNRQNQIVWRTTIALVINIALNVILIPRYGYMAAAIVTIITEIIGVFLSGLIIYRAYPVSIISLKTFTVLLSAIVTGLLLNQILARERFLENFLTFSHVSQITGLVASALGALVVYLLFLVVTGAIHRNDFNLLRGRS